MKFECHHEINGTDDSFIVEGETVEECSEEAPGGIRLREDRSRGSQAEREGGEPVNAPLCPLCGQPYEPGHACRPADYNRQKDAPDEDLLRKERHEQEMRMIEEEATMREQMEIEDEAAIQDSIDEAEAQHERDLQAQEGDE